MQHDEELRDVAGSAAAAPRFGRLSGAARWLGVLAIALVPLAVAAASPLQASRNAAWIVGGLAGVVALALLFLQPVLIGSWLPGLRASVSRRWHRIVGTGIVAAVLIHVGGLYLTSPEDVLDALTLASPTPFALYGVIGLVGVILSACIAAFRKALPATAWRLVHTALALVIVVASVVHAVQIEGVMGETTKWLLCASALFATTAIAFGLVRHRLRTPPRRDAS